MSRVLVTGANGQLGSEIRKLSRETDRLDYLFTDVEELDITNADAVSELLQERRPAYVINCAAYTHVDRAESDPEGAGKLNRDAVKNLLRGVDALGGTRIIHLSTDYVFGGDILRPLREEDPPAPLSVYGRTKLEGEQILSGHQGSLVIRTSWLYSSFGKNFVKSMIGRMAGDSDLRVVYDQIGTPTFAGDLARAIIQIITDVESGRREFVPGIYHYSDEGVCSWFDLAVEVCRMIRCGNHIEPVETSELSLPARRPAYSVLNKSRIKETYGTEVPYWRDSLEKCIKNLL